MKNTSVDFETFVFLHTLYVFYQLNFRLIFKHFSIKKFAFSAAWHIQTIGIGNFKGQFLKITLSEKLLKWSKTRIWWYQIKAESVLLTMIKKKKKDSFTQNVSCSLILWECITNIPTCHRKKCVFSNYLVFYMGIYILKHQFFFWINTEKYFLMQTLFNKGK